MVSQQIVDIIIKAQDQASAAANKVDESLQKIGKSGSMLSRIPGFDALRGKFTSLASTVSGKFGGAIDGVRKKLTSLSNGAKGLESAMGFLKGAVSMTAGMIGYDLVNSLMETTRASLNARSSMQAFASRLNMSSSEVQSFQQSLDELQNTYKKIDMDVVGQQATDMAYRLGLPKTALAELTETTAIFTDAMQRNGRSAEDSMLAMSDAMDGQFTRLKEIGISQEDLIRNGWSGDLEDKTGLLHAMNAALKEQHYDDLAKSVDTLDEAWQVLSITLSNLLEAIILPLIPGIVAVVSGFTDAINAIKPFVGMLQGLWNALPDWLQDTAWAAALVVALYALGTVIWGTVIPALAGAALAALEFAAAMLANPLTWVLVAIVAIALAVYELGKAFGWWSDVSGMWDAFLNNILIPVWEFLVNLFTPAWNFIGEAINAVMPFISNLTNAFSLFMNGQMSLPNLIMTVMSSLYNIYATIFTMVVTAVISWGTQILSNGINAATSFVNGVVNKVKQLPGKIYSQLVSAVSKIVSAGQQWVSNAKSKASSLVSGVTSTLSGLPGKISSALSGVVSAITSPFQSAYNQVVGIVNNLKSKVEEGMNYIGSLGGAFGGDELGTAVADNFNAGVDLSRPTIVNNGAFGGEITGELTLIHDLRNLPDGVSAGEVAEIVLATANSDEFGKAIASNSGFQDMDLKVKNTFTSRVNRANGV